MPKPLLNRFVLFAGLALAAPAAAAAEPGQAVIDFGNGTIQVLANEDRLSPAAVETKLRDLWRIGVDVPSVSRWVAGRSWVAAIEEQRREFVLAFEDYVVHFYAQLF
jgi:ABC-type transporter MlaC component